MDTQNFGPGGPNPQAQGLREIEEDLDAVRTTLQGLIDLAGGRHEELAAAVIEYHRRVLLLHEKLDRLGCENRDQAGVIQAQRDGLAELVHKLRLERLSKEQMEALIGLLKQGGGPSLQSGEQPVNNLCRGLPLEAAAIALALGCLFGVLVDKLGPLTYVDAFIGIPNVMAFGALVLFMFLCWMIHKISQKPTWQAMCKPGDLLVSWLCRAFNKPVPAPPAPPPEIATKRAEAEEIKTRADGIDAKQAELDLVSDRIVHNQDEMRRLSQILTGKTNQLEQKREQLELTHQQQVQKLEDLDVLLAAAPPDPVAITACRDMIRTLWDAVSDLLDEINPLAVDVKTLSDQMSVARMALEADKAVRDGVPPAIGLKDVVAELSAQRQTKLDEAKALEDAHNALLSAPEWHHFSRWKGLSFACVLLMVVGLWDVLNVNRVLAQSWICEGKTVSFLESGGAPNTDPRTRFIGSSPSLPLGKNGPVTAVEMGDTIVLFLATGEDLPNKQVTISSQAAPEKK